VSKPEFPIVDFDHWLQSEPGQYVQRFEQTCVDKMVADAFGYHALQVGLPSLDFLRANRMPFKAYVGADMPIAPSADWAGVVLAQPECLPFDSQSVDLLVLPHGLEASTHPHQVLREVERVLVPEGRVIIAGLNPLSLWGARVIRERFYARLGSTNHFMPIHSELIGPQRMKDWLTLLGFEVERGGFGLYKPSFESPGWLSSLNWMELAGNRWWPILGSAYILTAVKRVKGMRLLGASWKKPLHRGALLTRPSATSKHTAEKSQDEQLF